MELTFIVVTKNYIVATQKIKYETNISTNPNDFFKNLDGYLHKYIFEFQRNNSNLLKSLTITDTDGNIIREINVLEN